MIVALNAPFKVNDNSGDPSCRIKDYYDNGNIHNIIKPIYGKDVAEHVMCMMNNRQDAI